jgi:tetratricopeptide (TPR) repeat protein
MKKQFLTFLLFTLTALLGLGISVSAQSKCAVGDEDCKIDEASDKIANDPSDQEAYYLRGKAYYRKGDYDSALLDFDRYIALRPTDKAYLADGYVGRADAFRRKGSSDLAISDYNMAIPLAPKYTTAYMHRGLAYSDKKDYVSAIRDFNLGMKIDPSEPELYYNRALVYQKQKNYDQAIVDYNKYISLNTDNKDYLADGYYNRGLAYENKGSFTAAVSDFTEAINLDPLMRSAYSERAAVYRKLGKVSLAIADEAKAEKLKDQ